jgi:hypothetical protein
MIQVKKKTIYDAIQFTNDTHQEIKQIMEQQGFFVSDDATSITLLLTSDNGTLNSTIHHNDWVVKLDNGKFMPVKEVGFNQVFEQVI